MISKNKITDIKRTNYRMYKAKKQWVFASAAFITMMGAGSLVTTNVHADTVTPNSVAISQPLSASDAKVEKESSATTSVAQTPKVENKVEATVKPVEAPKPTVTSSASVTPVSQAPVSVASSSATKPVEQMATTPAEKNTNPVVNSANTTKVEKDTPVTPATQTPKVENKVETPADKPVEAPKPVVASSASVTPVSQAPVSLASSSATKPAESVNSNQPFKQAFVNFQATNANVGTQDDKVPTKQDLHYAMLGDSITAGVIGENGDQVTKDNLPTLLTNEQGVNVDNLGIGGAKILGDNARDLNNRVYKTDWSKYNSVVVMIGTNDYIFHEHSLDEIRQALDSQLAYITSHSKAKIVGVLPILISHDFHGPWLDGYNYWKTWQTTPNNWDYDQLCDMEKEVYSKYTTNILDWRTNPIVTLQNYKQTLGDHQIHPDQETYNAMAYRINGLLSSETGKLLNPNPKKEELHYAMLGDSITHGEHGYNQLVDNNLPNQLTVDQGIPVDNLGIGGAKILGDWENDFSNRVYKTDWSKYNAVIIMGGTNDYLAHNKSLNEIRDALDKQLAYITSKGTKVVGVLPILISRQFSGDWLNQTVWPYWKLTTKDWDYDQLCDMEKEVYSKYTKDILDWRVNPIVTLQNYQQTLYDKQVHPSQATYDAMAHRINGLVSTATYEILGEKPVDPNVGQEIKDAKYIATGYEHYASDYEGPEWSATDRQIDKLRVTVSNDGQYWHEVNIAPNADWASRDEAFIQLKDGSYLSALGNKTKDFIHWEKIQSFKDQLPSNIYNADRWAPEIFYDKDGNLKAIISARTQGTEKLNGFKPVIADYDSNTGKATNIHEIQIDNLFENDSNNPMVIDYHMAIINGKYYLFGSAQMGPNSRISIWESDNVDKGFSWVNTNLDEVEKNFRPEFGDYGEGYQGTMFEGPTTMEIVDQNGQKGVRLFYDTYDMPYKSDQMYHYMHYSDSYDGMHTWSAPTLMQGDFGMRHMNVFNQVGTAAGVVSDTQTPVNTDFVNAKKQMMVLLDASRHFQPTNRDWWINQDNNINDVIEKVNDLVDVIRLKSGISLQKVDYLRGNDITTAPVKTFNSPTNAFGDINFTDYYHTTHDQQMLATKYAELYHAIDEIEACKNQWAPLFAKDTVTMSAMIDQSARIEYNNLMEEVQANNPGKYMANWWLMTPLYGLHTSDDADEQAKTVNQSSSFAFYKDWINLLPKGSQITLSPMGNIKDTNDPNIQMVGNDDFIKELDYAQSQGVIVNMIKPHFGINWNDGYNRAGYAPSNVDEFFKNWKNILLNYAKIAHDKHVPLLSVEVPSGYVVKEGSNLPKSVQLTEANEPLTITVVRPQKIDTKPIVIDKGDNTINRPANAQKGVNDLPSGSRVNWISSPDSNKVGETSYPARVTFKDGTSQVVQIPVQVKDSQKTDTTEKTTTPEVEKVAHIAEARTVETSFNPRAKSVKVSTNDGVDKDNQGDMKVTWTKPEAKPTPRVVNEQNTLPQTNETKDSDLAVLGLSSLAITGTLVGAGIVKKRKEDK